MAQRDQQTPWIQSNLGAGIVAAVVGLALGIVINGVFDAMIWWLRLVLIAGAVVVGLIVMSLFGRRWRSRIWVAFGNWLRGLGVLTSRKRAVIRQEGYDAHVAEVAEQRRGVQQPAWAFDARDALGARNLLWLNNHGGAATDVHATADPEFFVSDGEIHWSSFSAAGPVGGYVGQWFKGAPTERGKVEGVMFHVTWVDSAGDLQARDVFFPPEELRAGRDEALQEEWEKGRVEGRAEAFAERGAIPAVPLPRPRWSVEFRERQLIVDRNGTSEQFALVNRIGRSVAREVRIDPDERYMRLGSAGHWPDLSGDARGEFVGTRSRDGQMFGVPMKATWYDESGEQQTERIELGSTRTPEIE